MSYNKLKLFRFDKNLQQSHMKVQ